METDVSLISNFFLVINGGKIVELTVFRCDAIAFLSSIFP